MYDRDRCGSTRAEETDKVSLISFLPPIDLDV